MYGEWYQLYYSLHGEDYSNFGTVLGVFVMIILDISQANFTHVTQGFRWTLVAFYNRSGRIRSTI